MKRTLLTAIMAVAAVAVFAGNPLKVKEGNKKFFKTAEGGALLEIIYDGATFDGKMPLTEKYNDIKNKTKISYDGFVEEFSERSKNVQIVSKKDDANYKITVKVTKVDEFVNVMGFIPGPCIRVWGTLTITDIRDGSTLLVVDIDEIDGGSAPTTDRAFNDTFGELGERIAKLK
jgi:hypothetical protein